ncbi:hypothetical protein [Georgenia sp. H159]|uniref:hypothetical protein n=1 Tax=Georgenia sp. H159 TaxID=3076115 RepID=UPI002D772B31|nr:hypothetical protein [Georgenia sp. H159]
MRTGTRTAARVAAMAVVALLAVSACTSTEETDAAPSPTATESASPEPTTEPAAPTPIIPDEVVADLDAAVAAEAEPIASTSAQTEGLPDGATLDVLQLDRTDGGGYLLRVRLGWAEPVSLSPAEHRSLSLDGDATMVDGIRLVDDAAERFTLPTVYAPRDEEQIDGTERFRCLCTDLVSQVPAGGQLLSAVFGPLGDGAQPEALTVEVPGFEPLPDVPVGRTA